MDRDSEPAPPTHYEVLHVHPAAPLDLITAAYWKLTGLVRGSRELDRAAEVALYHLTRSYQMLADHRRRELYDQSLGLDAQPLPRVPLRRRSSWMSRLSSRGGGEGEADASIDYYEVMRLDPRAHQAVVSEAYGVMGNYYLRLAEQGQVKPELVYLLEEAYEVLSSPEQRARYDESRKRNDGGSGGDSGGSGQSEHHALSSDRRRFRDRTSTPVGDEAKVEARSGRPQEALALQGTSVAVAVSESTGERRRWEPPRVKADGAMLATADWENGSLPGESHAGRWLETFVSASAQLLMKGGGGSVRLARAASRMLREAIDLPVRDENWVGPDYDEEEAVLTRLFLGSVSGGNVGVGDSTDALALARLTITEGPVEGASYEVRKVPAILGDGDACDIKLPGLASTQARLLHHSGQFVLHSLAEEPPTCVQGTPVSWTLLRDGDSFELGPYRLRFSVARQ